MLATRSNIRFEQVKALHQQAKTTLIGMALAAAVATAVLMPASGAAADAWRGHDALSAWLASVLALAAGRYALVRRFLRAIEQPSALAWHVDHADRMGLVFTAGSFLSGCLWGLLGILGFDPQAMLQTLFVGFLLGGMVSGALGSLSIYYPAFLAFALPAVLPFALVCLRHGSPELIGFGLLTLLFALVSLGYGRGLSHRLCSMIELRFENVALMGDLVLARDRAEQANAEKTALLAAATHDLRQPAYAAGLYVAGLQNALGAAKVQPDEPAVAQARRIAGQLEVSIAAFNGLLEGLLDLAQLDANAKPLRHAPVQLSALLTKTAHSLGAHAVQRGLQVRVRASPSLWVHAPQDELERIMLNLASNAIKFTTGGKVLLFARLRQGRVQIGVADAGPGIAVADQTRLFEPFVRLPHPSGAAGMGLGLAIVKRLAERLGAPIGLDSATGRGSLFTLSLVALPHSPAAGLLLAHAAAGGAGVAAPAALRQWQALVLDDDPLARAATTLVAESAGAQVLALASAEAALRWLAQAPRQALNPSRLILVADLHLGDPQGRDGLFVAAALSAQLPGLKALMITGETDPQQLQRIAASGVLALRKPCSAQALQEALLSLARTE